jgi:hypothetical protein
MDLREKEMLKKKKSPDESERLVAERGVCLVPRSLYCAAYESTRPFLNGITCKR